MNLDAFSDLPDDAQLWIYGFGKPLGEDERGLIGQTLERFLPQWMTHGVPVRGAFALAADRFALLAGHLEGGISGCSIDSSVRNFKYLRDAHGLDGLNRSLVFYRGRAGEIQAVAFTEFQKQVESGVVTADTIVFDTTLQTLKELRAGQFERRFADSWHAVSFPLPAASR